MMEIHPCPLHLIPTLLSLEHPNFHPNVMLPQAAFCRPVAYFQKINDLPGKSWKNKGQPAGAADANAPSAKVTRTIVHEIEAITVNWSPFEVLLNFWFLEVPQWCTVKCLHSCFCSRHVLATPCSRPAASSKSDSAQKIANSTSYWGILYSMWCQLVEASWICKR